MTFILLLMSYAIRDCKPFYPGDRACVAQLFEAWLRYEAVDRYLPGCPIGPPGVPGPGGLVDTAKLED